MCDSSHMRNCVTFLILTYISLGWLSSVGATVEEDEVNCLPQHVHLSYGEASDQVTVLWATNGTCDTRVTYGTSSWQLAATETGRSLEYTSHNSHGLHVLHRVLLKGLKSSTTYFYRPTSNRIGRGPFYFQTPPQETNWSPQFLVVGNLGPYSDLLPMLSEEALSGQYSAVLQLGGLSNYLADANGTKGDTLMKGLEHIAAFIPYMTAPGQNETADGHLPGYRHRFSMPGSAWPIPKEKLWYSFNLGLVHFVSYCTDVYLHGDETLQNLQYQWLVKDLSEANTQRNRRPWIVAFGHHPMYCTSAESGSDCAKNASHVRKGLEDTLYYYGVDLVLQSHNAHYERLYPLFKGVILSNNYTNPRAPVQITIGAASTAIAHGAGTVPSTDGSSNSSSVGNGVRATVKETIAAKRSESISAFKFFNGSVPTYGRLHIINATHAHWQLLSSRGAKTLAVAGKEKREVGSNGEERTVLDSLWVVQERHGKFQLSELPDNVGKKIDQSLVADGGQPGVLNVHDPEQEAKNLLAADVSRRIIIGASFGAFALLLIIVVLAIRLRRRVKRRSGVRRWDAMDYKYGKTKLHPPASDCVGVHDGDGEDDDYDDDFQDDHDFEMDMSDGSMQTKKLLNGK